MRLQSRSAPRQYEDELSSAYSREEFPEPRRQQQQDGAADHAPPEDEHELVGHLRRIIPVEIAGDLPGDVVAERSRNEPHTQRLTHEPRGRKLAEGAQP